MRNLLRDTKKKYRKYQDVIFLGIQGTRLLTLLNRATREHQQVEDLFAQRIRQGQCGGLAVFPYRNLSGQKYFERNFFSILFLSIFISLELPLYRRLRYGVILHCLRTIVTSADNILDRESKGAVGLEEDRTSPDLRNILLTLMAQTVISQTVRELAPDEAEARRIETGLLDSLYSVARGESVTSMAGREAMPAPEQLLKTVHEKIGGELLQLSLAAPREIETQRREPMRMAETGIMELGIALQMLDDVVDFEEDLLAGKTNLLASWILHHTPEVTWTQLREPRETWSLSAERFDALKIEVINAAVEKALDGFDWLARAGYPVKPGQARSILKIMFRLRGLEQEWNASAYA